MKGFYIEITNNLLDPKHKKAIGSAIWEFMWCLDKITSITEEGVGIILGGRPIKLEEFADELGDHRNTVSVNLNKLAKAGYLNIVRAPNGLILSVNKAKKRFKQHVYKRDSQKTVNHKKLDEIPKNSESNIRQDNDNTLLLRNNGKPVKKSMSALIADKARRLAKQKIVRVKSRVNHKFQAYALEAVEIAGINDKSRARIFDLFKKKNYGYAQVKKTLEVIKHANFQKLKTDDEKIRYLAGAYKNL